MSKKSLSKFLDEVPGSSFRLKDVQCILDSNGDLKEIFDIDVIINSIVAILTTVKGSYIFNPVFGVGLYRYIFEPADSITEKKILDEIKTNIATFEQRANVGIDITFLTSNKRGFQIDLVVEMNNDVRTRTITIDETIVKNII